MAADLISQSELDNLRLDGEHFASFVKRISELLDESPDSLFSMMYRLDVQEKKIKEVLHPEYPTPPAKALALLILQRHEARMKTRAKYRQAPIAGWDNFKT